MATESRVHIDKLETDNHGTWHRRVRALLQSKGLWGVIGGDDEDKDRSLKAKGLIELYLGDFYLPMTDDFATAKGLWEHLEGIFKVQNNARRLVLRQQMNNLKIQPSEPMSKFIARAKSIATDLAGVGHKPEDSELTLQVLAGLPKDYRMLVTIIGASEEDYTLDRVLPMLLQTEQQLKADQEEETAVAIYAARDASYGQKPRHLQQKNQKQQGYSNKPKIAAKCTYCGKPGHPQDDCYRRLNDEKRDNERTVAFGASAMKACSSAWIIDSGASTHLTPNELILLNYRSVETSTAVHFVNGQQAAVLGQGEVLMRVQTSKGAQRVELRNVLHVPEATVSLFSTRQAMDTGAQITFKDNKCFIYLNGKERLQGITQEDGMMIINQVSQQPAAAMSLSHQGNSRAMA